MLDPTTKYVIKYIINNVMLFYLNAVTIKCFFSKLNPDVNIYITFPRLMLDSVFIIVPNSLTISLLLSY